MNIIEILIASISISMILYYLYETDFLWEYLNKISKIIKIKKLDRLFYGILLLKAYKSSEESSYLMFINKIYNTFATRLISCPICFGFWISVIFSIVTKPYMVFVYSFFSLIFYYLIKILTKIVSKI